MPSWAWDWTTFWPTLVAGFLAFLGSATLVFVAYWLQRRADGRTEDQHYREVVDQLLRDLHDLVHLLDGWRTSVNERVEISDSAVPPLFWGGGNTYLDHLLARRDSYRVVRLADVWVQHAREAASAWNEAIKQEATTDDQFAKTLTAVNGALARVRDAVTALEA